MTNKTSFSKIVGSAAIGNILEYYDFFLFVYLAPHISQLFFPPSDKRTAMIAGLGIFSLGYFMRPLGAVFFGFIGDTFGRKQALTWSIILMAIPTMLIGCLPTYESIGIFSPILLTLCRLLQGLFVGGELIGAGIFAVENVKTRRRIFAGSFISSSTALGGLLGSLIAALTLLPFMPTWSWRGAFIAGALIAVYGLYIRLKVSENNPIIPNHERIPFLEAFKTHPHAIICTIGISAFSGVMFNISLSYVSIFLATVRNWPLTQSLSIVSFGTALYILIIPVIGRIAEEMGARKTMTTAIFATFLCTYPALMLLIWSETLFGVLSGVAMLVILSAWFIAPMNFYMASLFPRRCRYSGVAFSYSMGVTLFGGTTPMILSFLVKWTNNPLVCFYYAIFGALIGLISIKASKPVLSSDDPLITNVLNTSRNDHKVNSMHHQIKKKPIAAQGRGTRKLQKFAHT